NTWTHLAVTYDGATLRLFVNGTQVNTTPATGSLQTVTTPLRIGNNTYGESFQGRIDDVRIYNRAQTAAEIQSDMAVDVATIPPKLVILQPAAGAAITGTTVDVGYIASGDLTEVNHVHFKLDANPEVMDLSFDGVYQFTNVLAGSHVLQGYLVRADHSKILGTDTSVSFTTTPPDPTPPTVTITSPAAGANLTGTVNETADASDNSGTVAGVQVFLDGNPSGAEGTTAPVASRCRAGRSMLPDGRVFIACGAMCHAVGAASGRIVTPRTQSWTSGGSMAVGRWYSTVTTLPDGRLLVVGGEVNCNECNALLPEVFNPATGTWTQLTGAPLDLPYYPHDFVLPDGRILVTGANRRAIPTYALDLATQTW